MTLTLLGVPKSTQHIYRYACRGNFPAMYMTAQGKSIKEAYQWEAKSQWRGKPIEGDVKVSVRFFSGTKRRSDLDNFNKLWADALTGIVYQDDSQIADLRLVRDYDKARPRIEIEVASANL
jgi:Holliday junction resolvase RusA-like endonuclease